MSILFGLACPQEVPGKSLGGWGGWTSHVHPIRPRMSPGSPREVPWRMGQMDLACPSYSASHVPRKSLGSPLADGADGPRMSILFGLACPQEVHGKSPGGWGGWTSHVHPIRPRMSPGSH